MQDNKKFLNKLKDLTYEVKGVELPHVPIPAAMYEKYGAEPGIDNEEFLKVICRHAFNEFLESGVIPRSEKNTYIARFKKELEVFKETGFIDYILLIALVMEVAKENNVPMGAGRGSCGGSFSLFLISAVSSDPIKYKLYFERFISKARVKKLEEGGKTYLQGALCDVDLDVDSDKRHILVDKLAEIYDGHFCRVANFGTLTTPNLLKECCKIVLEYPNEEAELISKNTPKEYGTAMPYKEAKELDFVKPILSEEFDHIATLLEDLPTHTSVHASAFLVTKYPLDRLLPTFLNKDGELVSAYDKKDSEDEWIKLDLLGLNGVGIIKGACDEIGIDPRSINPEDPFIYEQLQDLEHPYGLFQISADVNFNVCRQIKPKNLSEASDSIAIGRPGALSQCGDYCSVKKGDKEVPKIHPIVDEILTETHGQLLYQESLLRILHEVYNFSLEEADDVRRCVGKKDKKGMALWEEKIYSRADELGIEKSVTDFYWDILDASSSYSFNRSHSISYAVLGAQTVYLKFKYPREFFLSCLNLIGTKKENIFKISKELPHFGIKLLPPDIIKSDIEFKMEGSDGIRYGLKSIKHISAKTFDSLKSFISEDKQNKFAVFEAAKKTGLKKPAICALISVGALESVSAGTTRNTLCFEAVLWLNLKDKEKVYCMTHGEKYNWNLVNMIKEIDDWQTPEGKRVAAKTRKNTLRKAMEVPFQIKKLNDKNPKLASWIHERRLLEFSYSHELRSLFKTEDGKFLQSIQEVSELEEGEYVDCVGEATLAEEWISRAGNPCFKVLLDDEQAQICGMITKEKLLIYKEFNVLPKQDQIVRVQGKRGDGNTVWIERMTVQDVKVVFENKDLKKLNPPGMECPEIKTEDEEN